MAKNCLIYETLNGVKDMSVKKSGEFMTLSGVFGVCGVRNNNQRVYETSNYSKMVSEMKKRIEAEGGIPGELEHPQAMNITLENISHKITDINIDENGLVTGSITLLNTPKGKIAQAIVEGGLPLFISSRATGNVDPKSGSVTLEKIATYDLVGSPGFSQARLSLNENQIAESINESIYYIAENTEENNSDTEDMELSEILEKLNDLEAEVKNLREENQELREAIEEKPDFNLETLANGIQNWIVEEYTPKVQEWLMEEYTSANNEEILEEIEEKVNKIVAEEVAPKIQDWVVEEYSPKLENWVVEEFGGKVEDWVVEEVAPKIQDWVVEEYSPNIENWLNESYMNKIQDNIDKTVVESKQNNLSAIDETLKVLESLEVAKPAYRGKALITECGDEPKFIREMPADVRVKWDLASNEVKESINRRAKLYNFVNEGSIERFWAGIDFNSVKPVQNVYEGLNAIEDERERAIRMKIRAGRFNR